MFFPAGNATGPDSNPRRLMMAKEKALDQRSILMIGKDRDGEVQ